MSWLSEQSYGRYHLDILDSDCSLDEAPMDPLPVRVFQTVRTAKSKFPPYALETPAFESHARPGKNWNVWGSLWQRYTALYFEGLDLACQKQDESSLWRFQLVQKSWFYFGSALAFYFCKSCRLNLHWTRCLLHVQWVTSQLTSLKFWRVKELFVLERDIRLCLATDAVAIVTTNALSQQKQVEFRLYFWWLLSYVFHVLYHLRSTSAPYSGGIVIP